MEFLIQVPSSDEDIIRELSELAGARQKEEEFFDGHKVIRILLSIQIASVAIAGTAENADKTTKSVVDIVQTLRPIFRKGIDRHRNDPNGDFVVFVDNKRFLHSEMKSDEIEKKLLEL
jgi:uncharacterized protein (DUF2236 family)